MTGLLIIESSELESESSFLNRREVIDQLLVDESSLEESPSSVLSLSQGIDPVSDTSKLVVK